MFEKKFSLSETMKFGKQGLNIGGWRLVQPTVYYQSNFGNMITGWNFYEDNLNITQDASKLRKCYSI